MNNEQGAAAVNSSEHVELTQNNIVVVVDSVTVYNNLLSRERQINKFEVNSKLLSIKTYTGRI